MVHARVVEGGAPAKFGDPQSLNLYSFVENSPIDRFDPDGHMTSGDFRCVNQRHCVDEAAPNGDSCDNEAGNCETGEWEHDYILQAAEQSAAQNQSQTQTQQNQPPSPGQKVLTQVEKEFPDLNVTNVKDLKAHNGHENISVTGSATN